MTSVVWIVVREQIGLEDAHERELRLVRAAPLCLQPALPLEPHRTLRHPRTNPQREERRDDAHPEHDAPAEIRRVAEEGIDELKGRGREEIAPVPAAQHQPRGEAAQPCRPVFEDERHAGRPLAAHAEAEQRADARTASRTTARTRSGTRRARTTAPRSSAAACVPICRRRFRRCVPPTSRIMSVTVPSAPASARSTVKLFWMSMMMNARMLKSKESTTQPRNTAQKARHWSRETCRYQGRAMDGSSTTPGTADAALVLTPRDSSCAGEVCRTACIAAFESRGSVVR